MRSIRFALLLVPAVVGLGACQQLLDIPSETQSPKAAVARFCTCDAIVQNGVPPYPADGLCDALVGQLTEEQALDFAEKGCTGCGDVAGCWATLGGYFEEELCEEGETDGESCEVGLAKDQICGASVQCTSFACCGRRDAASAQFDYVGGCCDACESCTSVLAADIAQPIQPGSLEPTVATQEALFTHCTDAILLYFNAMGCVCQQPGAPDCFGVGAPCPSPGVELSGEQQVGFCIISSLEKQCRECLLAQGGDACQEALSLCEADEARPVGAP